SEESALSVIDDCLRQVEVGVDESNVALRALINKSIEAVSMVLKKESTNKIELCLEQLFNDRASALKSDNVKEGTPIELTYGLVECVHVTLKKLLNDRKEIEAILAMCERNSSARPLDPVVSSQDSNNRCTRIGPCFICLRNQLFR
ncbi:hypothetical protein PMAYCL1PPCAC_30197, partial [Pristionchus mayeri]